MKLGISGFLTQTFIRSPLTPLLLLASLALGSMALMLLPREEEPQISVPMVDVLVRADGLKAEDAVELVTKPLEDIVKGIDAVEHVYSADPGRPGHGDGAFLRRHRRGPGDPAGPRGDPRQHQPASAGHSRAADRRSRHQRRADRDPDPVAEARRGGKVERQRALRHRRGTAARDHQDRGCRPDLHRRRPARSDPRRARSRTAVAVRRDAEPVGRQGPKRQPFLRGRPVAAERPLGAGRRRSEPCRGFPTSVCC